MEGDQSDIDRDRVLISLGFDLGVPTVSEEVIVEFSAVVVGIVVHEGQGEGGQGVVLFIEGGAVGLDDGWVVGHELDEVKQDVGEEDGEEDSSANEGLFGGDAVVLGDWDEAEDI